MPTVNVFDLVKSSYEIPSITKLSFVGRILHCFVKSRTFLGSLWSMSRRAWTLPFSSSPSSRRPLLIISRRSPPTALITKERCGQCALAVRFDENLSLSQPYQFSTSAYHLRRRLQSGPPNEDDDCLEPSFENMMHSCLTPFMDEWSGKLVILLRRGEKWENVFISFLRKISGRGPPGSKSNKRSFRLAVSPIWVVCGHAPRYVVVVRVVRELIEYRTWSGKLNC